MVWFSKGTTRMNYWPLYFLLKVALFYRGHIGFHWALNLALGVALAWPLPLGRWRLLRTVLAWPAALGLLYHDSYLPSPERVLTQGKALLGFSADYLLELLQRLFSPTLVLGLALVAIVLAYDVLARRIRFATLAWASILSVPVVATLQANPTYTALAGAATADQWLKAFYAQQSQQRVQLRTASDAPPPFDIIVLHVCSLSWDDMQFVGLREHPFLQRFDVVLSNFNSAASYSGPASLRLLHGTCGQPSHHQVGESNDPSCYVFPSLEKLGYQTGALLNHDGLYENFATTLEKKGGFKGKILPNQNAPVHMQNFDGSPIYNNRALLSQWWKKRLAQGGPPAALYYNTISLHNGNRIPGMRSRNSLDTYKPRLLQLFADFDEFINELENAQRPVVVVLVPEHGAALRSDKMQIAGMREIPSPRITLVPVALKLVGLKTPSTDKGPLVVAQPMSYLGLFTLLGDWLAENPYASPARTLAEQVQGLPSTPFVAENADVITMRRDDGLYRLKAGDDPWIAYTP